jgi:CRP-like cAMP-binding protein
MRPRTAQTPSREGNLLLATLPRRRSGGLLSSFKTASFELGQVLYEPGESVKHVVFPVTAMLSVIAEGGGRGRSVEIAVVGSDGMAGLDALLGGKKESLYRVLVQLPGEALRLPLSAVREAAARPGPFQKAVNAYTSAFIVETSRAAVCNALHGIDERLAKWILRTQDHARSDRFPMRQDFMAKMLAARRPAVSEAARRLRRNGVIDYRRGTLTVLDRQALEQTACACYQIIRDAYAQLTVDG